MTTNFLPLNDLRDLMDVDYVNKNKINSIKHIRAFSGEGLKEAKDFFEKEWLPFVNGTRESPKIVKELISDSPDFHNLVRQVEQLSRDVEVLKQSKTRNMAAGIFTRD